MSTSEATSTRPRRDPGTDPTHDGWDGRPVAAFVVRALVFIAPLAAAIAASYTLASLWPRPTTNVPSVLAWWVMLVAAGTITMAAVDRIARRFLPLAALLRMTLVFPDEAPSRYGIALRSGTIKQLERRVAEIRDTGAAVTEARGAEALLELAAALAQHDRFTRGHGERVRAYSAMIGAELGLNELEQSKLQWAGLIHDVGKLAVPAEILNKTGTLTEEEWDVIKTHPAKGMALIHPLAGWLGEWSLAVGEHHERWDGKGYPTGLAGDEISLAGRIVAVADVFDVITAARSYKKPQSPVVARQELAANAGTQFDPLVVRAFLNISLGKLRLTMWPLSWVANLPLIGPTVTAPASGLIATASLAVFTAVAGGALPDEAEPPATLAAVVENEQSSASDETIDLAPPGDPTTTLAATPVAPFSEPAGDWAATSITTGSTTIDSATTPTTGSTTSTSPVPTSPSSSTASTNGSTTSTTEAATTTAATNQLTDCEAAQAGETNLVGGDLVGCDLSKMTLDGLDLRDADLSNADLTETTLTNFSLDGGTLNNAVLEGAKFIDGSMVGATADNIAGRWFQVLRVDMSTATITNSNFARGGFEEVSFASATLDDTTFVQVLFIATNFNDAQAVRTVFDQSEHRNSEFYRTTANYSSFFMAIMRDSRLDDGHFVDADFSNAVLTATVLSRADFDLVDLTRTDLSTASGVPTNFATADFQATICPGNSRAQSTPCW